MKAHEELSKELEPILLLINDDDAESMPDYLMERLEKERNRLEMLLEVLEEDSDFERTILWLIAVN
mgnify:CR=1 FL=1